MKLQMDDRCSGRAARRSAPMVWLSRCLVFLVSAAFALGWLTAHLPQLRAAMVPLDPACTGCGIPEGLTEAEWDSIVAAIERDQYRIQQGEHGTYRAFNPAHGLLAEFTPDGFQVRPSTDGPDSDWSWGLQLTGYGYGNRIQPAEDAELAVEGNRIEYRRGDLVEWYVNEQRGLEQGFTLASPPGNRIEDEPLELRFAHGDDWTPEVASDALSITWRHVGDNQELEYSGLLAFDAAGHVLPVRLAVSEERRIAVVVQDGDAIYPITIDPFIQEGKLVATEADCANHFGVAKHDISGDVVAVGAYVDCGAGQYCGAVYVFEKPATGWADMTEVAKLTASDAAEDDFLGGLVAIHGDTVVATAHGVDYAGVDVAGAIYVFEKPGGGWIDTTETAKLTRSTTGLADDYGTDNWSGFGSLAFDGTTIVVGSPLHGHYEDIGMDDIGLAYVYERPGTGWVDKTEDAILDHTRTAANENDEFGRSVAVDGDTVVVSCPFVDIAAASAGAVYVYERPVTGWVDKTEDAVLSASDAEIGDCLGENNGGLAIDGDTVVAGAGRKDHPANPARTCGAVYIFEKPVTGWVDATEVAKLTPSNCLFELSDEPWLGGFVDIDGETLVASGQGSYCRDESNQFWCAGEVYVFEKPLTGWTDSTEDERLTRGDYTYYSGEAATRLGQGVHISGHTIVAGVLDICVGLDQWGPVYVFGRTQPGMGVVIVEKETDPPSVDIEFTFADTIPSQSSFGLDHGHWKSFNNVAPGTYTITEDDPEISPGGYYLTDLVCTEDVTSNSAVDVGTRQATITVEADETVRCTFTDNEMGTIRITKDTSPDGGAGFSFTDDIEAPNSFTLGDAETKTFRVRPGTYTVTEDDPGVSPGGYYLTSLTTNDGDSIMDLGSRTATINIGVAETVVCTFYNYEFTTVTVTKLTSPAGLPDSFGFSDEIEPPNAFDLTHGQTKTFTEVRQGSYSIFEDDPSLVNSDLRLTDISLVLGGGGSLGWGNLETREARIIVLPGDTIDVTFTNSEAGTIIVEKLTDPPDVEESFDFQDNGIENDSFSLEHGESKIFNVAPGTYSIFEDDPAVDPGGFVLAELAVVEDGINNSYGDRDILMATVNLEKGETVTCTYTNVEESRAGTIIIEKLTDPAGAPDTFSFQVDIHSSHSRNLTHGETAIYQDLLPGTYTVTENSPPAGFALASLTFAEDVTVNSVANLGTRTATINLDAGETVTCTFTNAPPGIEADLSITKSDSPDPICAGNNLTYTLTIANNGPENDPETITVTDTLPPGVAFVSASGSAWTCNEDAGVVTCTRAGLDVGAAPVVTVTVAVDAATSGTITNNASVSSPTTDNTPGNDSTSEDTTVQDGVPPTPSPMTWSTAPHATGSDTIEMTATSATDPPSGPSSLARLSTDTPALAITPLPETVRFEAVGVASLRVAIYDLSGHNVWDSGVQSGGIVDWGRASASGERLAYGAYLYSVQGRNGQGVVVLAESGKLTVLPGQQIELHETTSGISPADGDPGGVEYYFEETSGDPGGTDSGWQDSPTYTDLGLLPDTEYCYRVKARDTSPCQNETEWSSTACATTDPAAVSADLSVSKSDNPDPILIGTNVFYTLTVTNNGPDDATGVTVIDTLPPAGCIIKNVVPSQGTYTDVDNIITCSLGELANSATATITIVIKRNAEGAVTNNAAVSSNEFDPNTSDNSAAEETTFSASCPTGTVIIDCDSSTGFGTFQFEGNIERPSFPLGTATPQTFNNVSVGTYFITEQDPSGVDSGFVVTSISCVEDVNSNSTADVFGRTITINVEAGETVTVTFTNTEASQATGTIIVQKQTSPAGAAEAFGFTTDIGAPTTFTLADSQSQTYNDVPMGQYTVTEDDPSGLGFGLTTIACDDGDSSGDVGSRTATIKLEVGETVTCTFTNAEQAPATGTIIIEKVTSPTGGTGFGFTDDIESPNAFGLDHGQSKTFVDVPVGTYTVIEDDPGTTPGGYALSSISCDDGNSTGDVGARTATISLEAEETVTCTFTNTQQGAPDTAAVFRVDPSGNVFGDGTFFATEFLTGAADVAEWVTVSEPVEPGDVLELDPTASSTYRLSRGRCSTLIAGVVSTEPGFALGAEAAEATAAQACLALCGIVPVKVTDEGGPILPGDLLVASSTPGYAMRWNGEGLSMCALVGKALGAMTDTSGVVLALLTAH